MKIHLTKFLSIFIMILIISCNGNNSMNEKSEVQNPDALQDNSSLKRLTKLDGNLVDELYQELVEKKSELKSLETELNEFESKPNETQNIFYNYNRKSEQYYGSAFGLANRINDSLVKHKILDIIKRSSENYNRKSKEIDEIVTEISIGQNSIQDSHNILKLILTIPIIEKFQTENLPKKEKFQQTIIEQKKLKENIFSKIPKY